MAPLELIIMAKTFSKVIVSMPIMAPKNNRKMPNQSWKDTILHNGNLPFVVAMIVDEDTDVYWKERLHK